MCLGVHAITKRLMGLEQGMGGEGCWAGQTGNGGLSGWSLSKDFGFDSGRNEKPLQDFEQRNNTVYLYLKIISLFAGSDENR